MPRLFVALTLPASVRQHLALLCHGLPNARWMDEHLHLTLRFIGEVDGTQALDIQDALTGIDFSPFSLSLSGTGHFPPRGAPKVLWAGISPPTDPLAHLKHHIDQTLIPLGIGPDPRQYAPHVTLARLQKTPPRRVADWLSQSASYLSIPFEVRQFHLFSSTLTGQGAHHRLCCSYGPQEEQ